MEKELRVVGNHPMAWLPDELNNHEGSSLSGPYVVQFDEQGIAEVEGALESFKSS